MQKIKIINNTNLKLIAMFCMLADHIPWILWDMNTNLNLLSSNILADIFHMLGRIAFPLFAFCISEGYRHTSNLKLYTRRVGILAFVSIVPFALMFGSLFGFIVPQNTVFTLFLGLCALYFSDKVDSNWKKSLIVLLFVFLSVPADAGISGVLGIYLFSKLKSEKQRILWGILGLCSFQIVLLLINPSMESFVDLCFTIVPFVLLTIGYSGEKGTNINKLFYIPELFIKIFKITFWDYIIKIKYISSLNFYIMAKSYLLAERLSKKGRTKPISNG